MIHVLENADIKYTMKHYEVHDDKAVVFKQFYSYVKLNKGVKFI